MKTFNKIVIGIYLLTFLILLFNSTLFMSFIVIINLLSLIIIGRLKTIDIDNNLTKMKDDIKKELTN